jgi:hypothetical protein
VSNIAAYLFGLSRQLDRPLRCNRWGFFIMEIWKPIKDYESLYQVSNLGRVRSLRNKIKILSPRINSGGYNFCGLYKNGIRKYFAVHRLVAYSFLNEKNEKYAVNHINEIKTDNRVENLEWVSSRENCCHKFLNKNIYSKYTGVTFHKSRNKWQAQIFINGKSKYLGCFTSEEDAYKVRLDFELNNNIINKYI